MKFLKFMFTARMSFAVFAVLAFVFTLLYVAWTHHNQTRLTQHPTAIQAR